MSLTIKAFLYERSWLSNPVEIRRFTVDQDVSSSYAYLLEKVVQVFPSVKSDNIILAWTDSDGDIVTISSDEELVEALDQFEGNIFRLYLRRTPCSPSGPSGGEGRSADSEGQQQEQSGESTAHQGEGTFHPGVICDSCNGPVIGIRYKCLVCHDYDLCSLCEGKGVHLDHNMVSIPKPHPWGRWHPHDGFGGRGRGGYCRGRGGRGRFGGGQFGGRPYPCGGGGQGFIPPWFQGFGQGGGPTCWGAKPAEKPEKSKGEGEAQEPMDTEQRPAPSEDDRRTFLQGVGEAVSSFLEPFGVKVDVDVLGGGDGEKSGAAKTTTDAANAETEVSAEVVEEALAQLKSMGYQDEGGWLVELVKAKGGDVTKVLDALHPTVEQD